ncbi:MAG: glycosyltransferase family 2 protein [Promethearchaeota archaeon]
MYHEDTDFSLKALRNNIPIYTTNKTVLRHQKLHMMLNDFTYYYLERNRYIILYKNIKNLRNLAPYLIISEFMLLFQSILTKKFKVRLRIYKFLIQNNKQLRDIRKHARNSRTLKIKKEELSSNFDDLLLGRFPSQVKVLKYFLKLINFIF